MKETQSFSSTEFAVMQWAEARGIYKNGTALGQASKTVEEACELLIAITKDGRDKSIEDIDVGLFSQNAANNADVIKLMTNEIPCSEYRYAQSEVGLWYIEKGVGFTCRVSVPPDNHRFVGQITVGWAQQPENLEQIKFMLEIASAMLTKRGN